MWFWQKMAAGEFDVVSSIGFVVESMARGGSMQL